MTKGSPHCILLVTKTCLIVFRLFFAQVFPAHYSVRDHFFQKQYVTGADVNIAGTTDEEVPLVTAVKSSSARCVKEIIQMYPKQLHVQVRKVTFIIFNEPC